MKWRWVFTALVLIGVAATLSVWLGQEPPTVDDAPRGSDEARPSSAPRERVRVARGRIAGHVVNPDKTPARATVALRSVAPFFTSTLDDGAFVFDDVPEGPVYLSASTAQLASEVVGPLQVSATTNIDDLVLMLAPAVGIEGVVVDLVTHEPIVRATVISAQKASITEATGIFHLTGAKGGLWLDISAPGYLSRSEWVSLELARTGGKLEVPLTPASRLEGTVTENGAPVSGATVWAEHVDGSNRGVRTTTVFSGRDGAFLLETPSALLRLAGVTPRGTRIKGPLLRVAVGEKRSGIMLEAGDVSAAQGVVSREGDPLAGAQVSAIDAQTEDVVAVATSLPDGRFSFNALSTGRYVVQVKLGNFSSIAGPFEHVGDGRVWQVAVHAGLALDGRVVPAMAGVLVRYRSGTWSGPSADTVTDTAGRFHFDGLPAEVVSIDAEGPAGAATTRARPGDAVVLRLSKGQVIVHVNDDTGAAVTDGVLVARSLDTGAMRRQLMLAPDGVTRLDLPVGQWELSAEVTGRARTTAARVEVRDAPIEVRLTLEAAAAVHGTVTDAVTHLPIAGVFIEVRSATPFDGTHFRVTVVTDARGAFALPPAPKVAWLEARHPSYKTQGRQVGLGEPWVVDLVRESQPRQDAPALQFEGIGMVIDADLSAGPKVAGVNEGSPAERAGIQRGDFIVAVEGQSVVGLPMEQLVNRIRGPAGTEVHIAFRRAGQSFELSIRRKMLTL